MLLSRRSPSLLLVPTGSPPSCRLRCAVRALALPSSRPAALLLAMPLARSSRTHLSSPVSLLPPAGAAMALHTKDQSREGKQPAQKPVQTLVPPHCPSSCAHSREGPSGGAREADASGQPSPAALPMTRSRSSRAHPELSLSLSLARSLALALSLSLSLPPPPPPSPTPSLSLSDPSLDLRHLR
jgi:hypothetical protein